MASAMDSRNDAAAPLPLYPPALLSLPDLDRPPAIMEMWDVEAVATALPAKKRRLRETFDRLAACSPTPLPFRWEDLDTYISSVQYSVTLRRRQLRELEKSEPAPALAPPPASMSRLPVTGGGGGDVGQVRVLEKPRPAPAPAPAPAPVLPAVLALPATDVVDVHELGALMKSKPVQPQPPAAADPAAAVSAPAATGVHVEEGRKRKASIQAAEEAVHVVKRTKNTQQEGQAEMRSRKIQEDAAVKKTTSPSHDINGKELAPVPRGDDDNGLAAEANASTDATVQVAGPVSKIDTILQPELPEPATARDATNRERAAGVPSSTGLQRSRPPRPVPAASAAAAAVTRRDLEKSKKRKVPSPEVEAATASHKVQTQHAVREVERRREAHDSVVTTKNTIPSHVGGEATVSPRRPGPGSGLPITATARVDAEHGGTRHEPPATTPDVELDASMAAKKACHTKAIIKNSEQDDKVTAAAGGGTVRKSSPTMTRGSPNLVQARAPAPKSAAGVLDATRDASASHATTQRAPPAAGSQQDASDVSPVPPRRGNGLAQSSRVSAGAGTQTTDSACDSPHVRQGAPAAGAAPARRDLSATNPLPASRREHTGSSEVSAPLNDARRHVLQQQHMPRREPISSSKKIQEWSSKNEDGRPTGSRPVPEAQDDAADQRSWSRPGEGRSGGLPAARGPARGDDDNRNKDSFKGRRPLFCDNCGCKGHLAENCRTAKHLVALYQKAKEQKEKEKKEHICFRCGCTGHWSRNCRTAKHLVDLYQKGRSSRQACRRTSSGIMPSIFGDLSQAYLIWG